MDLTLWPMIQVSNVIGAATRSRFLAILEAQVYKLRVFAFLEKVLLTRVWLYLCHWDKFFSIFIRLLGLAARSNKIFAFEMNSDCSPQLKIFEAFQALKWPVINSRFRACAMISECLSGIFVLSKLHRAALRLSNDLICCTFL